MTEPRFLTDDDGFQYLSDSSIIGGINNTINDTLIGNTALHNDIENLYNDTVIGNTALHNDIENLYNNTVPTNVAGSVSGSVEFNMPIRDTYDKKVIAYLDSLSGTADYVYPVAFTYTPSVSSDLMLSDITSISNTGVTITGGGSDTGFIVIEGY